MYCPNCSEIQEGNNFCFSCGKKLESITNIESKSDSVANKTIIEKTKESNQNPVDNKTLTAKSRQLIKGSTGWMIFGFISAILGGLLGIAMGAHYAWSKKKYDTSTRNAGYIMMVIGVICLLLIRL